MKKRYVNLILAMASASVLVLGSVPAMAKTDETKTESGEEAETSGEKDTDADKADTLEDGVYTAEFDTDSSMFHVNEACEGKGTLTVKDAIMTIHVSMPSKNIVNLYPGLAEDAQKKGAELLVFPELCLSGYTCNDLFQQEILLEQVKEELKNLVDFTK